MAYSEVPIQSIKYFEATEAVIAFVSVSKLILFIQFIGVQFSSKEAGPRWRS